MWFIRFCTAVFSSTVSASSVRKYGVRTIARPLFSAFDLPARRQNTSSSVRPASASAHRFFTTQAVPSVEPLSMTISRMRPAYVCANTERMARAMPASSLRALMRIVTGIDVRRRRGSDRFRRFDTSIALIRKPGSSAMPKITHHTYAAGRNSDTASAQRRANSSETASQTTENATDTMNFVFAFTRSPLLPQAMPGAAKG